MGAFNTDFEPVNLHCPTMEVGEGSRRAHAAPAPQCSANRMPTATHAASAINILASPARQGLTLVHFSAQPEPFLPQNIPQTPPYTP
jgi:hypothetical protein